MKKGEEYIVHIEDLEFPSYGIASIEDKKIKIKGGVIGQKALIRITKKRKSKIEGKIIDILEKADYEIAPSCPVFGTCGGCTYQNLDYNKQLQFKEYKVLNLFKKANISIPNYLGIQGSPEEWEYRNKMEFTFGDFTKGGELELGLHTKKGPMSIISTKNCKLIDIDFINILTEVLNYFKAKNIPHYNTYSHEGYLRNLIIRKGKNTGDIIVNIITTSQINFDLKEISEKLKTLNYKGNLKGILHTFNDSLSDAVIPEKVEILNGKDYIIEDLLGLKFKITPFSFFQTNSKGTEKLYSIVRKFLGDSKDKIIFDLYCGTGTIGQIVAPKAKKVIGVEIIEEAVEAANNNAKLNNLNNCKFIAGDVAKVIKDINENPDVIILDPPRPGVSEKALNQVIQFNPKEIIYVSCNPKTLVQNLQLLDESGYKVDKVELMDMFPQTPHIETVVQLIK